MCLVVATGEAHSWLIIKVYGFRLYTGYDKKHGILNSGASPQLECWNAGMMEHWNNGFWGIDGMGYWENQVVKC